METTDRPQRPWAQGIGLLILGLFISAAANGVTLYGGSGPALRAAAVLGYGLGVLVAGIGIHRLLWIGSSRRRRWERLLITGIVTIPAFLGAAILFSIVFTILQIRFSY